MGFLEGSDHSARIRRGRAIGLALVLLLAVPAFGAGERRILKQGAERSAPVTPFVFDGDVRELPGPAEWKPGDAIREIPRRLYPEPGSMLQPEYEPGPDPLVELQRSLVAYRSRTFDAPTRNFPGQGFSGVNPPDTVGDVGPNHFIQMINGGGGALVAIYDKEEPTPTLLSTFTLDSLGSGQCASGRGDPIVLYDRYADRWMMSEFSFSGNNLCVYISQTPDPVSGGWFAYGYVAPSFPDYPKYAVWPTDRNDGAGSYIVTANDGGPGVYALDRGAMLAGSAGTYQRVAIGSLPGFSFQAPTPADPDGPNAPPGGAPAIIMRHRDTEVHSGPVALGDLLEMWTYDVDWLDSGNTTVTAEPSVDVAEFSSELCGLTAFFCFPQPGSSTTLDPLREVIMNRLQYYNHGDRETLMGNFVVDADGNETGGLRWFELERTAGSWDVRQEGTYSPDSDSRWMAGSSMDQSGNIAIAYNISSNTTFPSLRYTGRLADDPLGVMTQPETVIHPGTSPNSSNRYGDYSAMGLDPSDDCTFWFTGMDNTSGSWRTQIASFAFDACGCELAPEPPFVDAVVAGDNRIDVSWNDSSLETVIEYLVQRSRTPGGPYETVAVVPDSSPGVPGGAGYAYTDLDVSGGITYYYIVVASDGVSCKSDPVNEASETATGLCTLPPVFDGLQAVDSPFSAICTLSLSWNAGVAECGGPLRYSVYRSVDPDFVPGPGNRIQSNVNDTMTTDLTALVSGTTYYYVVRAVDLANGVEEANAVVVAGFPQGLLAGGTWTDDAGDAEPAKMIVSAPWKIDPNEGSLGPKVYKTGDYGSGTCADLRTPVLQLGTGSQLAFTSRYDIEPSWDKGEVQISTDGVIWERVPLSYPGQSTNTSDSCGLPTGSYFTGTNNQFAIYAADLSAWNDQAVTIRFLISSDGSVTGAGWWIDDISVSNAEVPQACATGSSCEDNPVVDVEPEGPATVCLGTILSADIDGGAGAFSYQWVEDGAPIPGAKNPTFRTENPGTHVYNLEVQAPTCDDKVFDGVGSELTLVDTPFFDGIVSASDAQGARCSVGLAWGPAATVCDGPIRYYVYRDTNPAVPPTTDNLIASGLTGTTLVDSGALDEGVTYHYRVLALDPSTGKFDGNGATASATPTGPGTGPQVFFAESFQDPASLDPWTITTQPNKTCPEWQLDTNSLQRPSGGSGTFAISDFSGCGNPNVSTTLESPAIDLNVAGLESVQLSVDAYYKFLNGGDTATIEAWDGATWQVLWTDPGADFNGPLSFDVTALAAGNPAFRVRFSYVNTDAWFSVDDVIVSGLVVNPCVNAVGPPPVPAGFGSTGQLRADRATVAGDVLDVTWDAATCTAADYNLLYGSLSDMSTYSVSGSECSVGTGGSFTWSGVPAGDLYFLLVGTDGAGTEGSWGRDGFLGERNGVTPSGQCGVTTKDISGTCP